MTERDLVQARDLLVKAMGCWPSFHDAEVLKVARTSDSCAVTIHVFEMTDQLDPAGYFVLRKHHLVELCLLGVQADSLPSTYEGDVLNGLSFQREGPCVRVRFDSHMDRGGEVLCEEVLIKSVVPYDDP
ncbi:MAG: hypothetical protein QOF88_3166 [Mycobacterium sp.]|jgi:hypothetical protein|nr:hypothetical protein [Mycobacterium sp.]